MVRVRARACFCALRARVDVAFLQAAYDAAATFEFVFESALIGVLDLARAATPHTRACMERPTPLPRERTRLPRRRHTRARTRALALAPMQVRDVIADFDGVVLTGGAALYAPANTAIAGLLHPLLVHVPSAPHDATLSVRVCLLVRLLVPSLFCLFVC